MGGFGACLEVTSHWHKVNDGPPSWLCAGVARVLADVPVPAPHLELDVFQQRAGLRGLRPSLSRFSRWRNCGC